MNASTHRNAHAARSVGSDELDAEPESVFAALDDDACRRILRETNEEALTATELSEACDIPLSTTYRKLDVLENAGLLEERVRLNTSGKHASEYVRRFDDVTVTVGTDGEFEIRITE